MALNGIGGAASGIGLQDLTPRPAREGEERKPATVEGARVAHEPVRLPESESVLPAEPPPGTDPAFWSVLTTEERVFFSKLQTLGPLTYGPKSAAPQAAMARGGRLDVKV